MMAKPRIVNVEPIGLDQSSMPFGSVPEQEFRELHFEFRPGDTWLVYTDGVNEAQNRKSELYGKPRLCKLISRGPDNVEAMINAIVDDVNGYCEGQTQSDDICLVAVRRL